MRENFQTMTAFNQNNISILSSIPNLQEFKDVVGHNVSTQITKESKMKYEAYHQVYSYTGYGLDKLEEKMGHIIRSRERIY